MLRVMGSCKGSEIEKVAEHSLLLLFIPHLSVLLDRARLGAENWQGLNRHFVLAGTG